MLHGSRDPSEPTTQLLTHRSMPTKFGERERPYLEIVGWVRFGAHGGLEAIESNIQPETQQRCIGSTAPATAMQSVSEPSLSEEMGGDTVPF